MTESLFSLKVLSQVRKRSTARHPFFLLLGPGAAEECIFSFKKSLRKEGMQYVTSMKCKAILVKVEVLFYKRLFSLYSHRCTTDLLREVVRHPLIGY